MGKILKAFLHFNINGQTRLERGNALTTGLIGSSGSATPHRRVRLRRVLTSKIASEKQKEAEFIHKFGLFLVCF